MRNMVYGLVLMGVLTGTAIAGVTSNALYPNGLLPNGLTKNVLPSSNTDHSQLRVLFRDAGNQALVGSW